MDEIAVDCNGRTRTKPATGFPGSPRQTLEVPPGGDFPGSSCASALRRKPGPDLSYTLDRCEESDQCQVTVTSCPFCECIDIRQVFEADDGLKSYQCHECARTFHVTEVQLPEPEKDKASEVAQVKSPEAPKKR